MATSNRTMIYKLQMALNKTGNKVLVDKTQFYSEEQDRPITWYKISKYDPDNPNNSKKQKLFETASSIQVVLFLRDYWNWVNGIEIPTDNEVWNEIKKQRGIVFNG